MTAREHILQQIRSALKIPPTDPSVSYSLVSRSYRRLGSLDTYARVDLLVDRLADYDSEVLQVQDVSDLPSAIATALSNASEARAVVSPTFPKNWLPDNFQFLEDHNLSIEEIEGLPAVITTCEAAVASTGTILLVHEREQARRVLTLLPNHHICLIHREQVFELLPEALKAIAPHATEPITTISGPSATSDIEMTRIRGVHGPRSLTAILYG